MYRVAHANQLLVVTGFGIPDFRICKKSVVWPYQKCNVFSVTPLNYEVDIQALSHEKLSLKIQSSLTIGPNVGNDDNNEFMRRYVKLLVSSSKESEQEAIIRNRIMGIVEGEMRGVAASMAIEEIFNDRRHFQDIVRENIQEALDKFGCVLYNANVEELIDTAGYFAVMGQKAHEGAVSSAKVAVAESKAQGDIGAQERVSRAIKETSRMKAETTVFENERFQTVAQSKMELEVKEANLNAQVRIAKIEGDKAAEMRQAELQKNLEKQRAAVETERLRADELAKAIVEAEKIKQLADARAYEKTKQAEASLYQAQKLAEGQLISKDMESQGVQKMYTAQASGLQQLIGVFNNPQFALQYLMLEKGLFQELAAQNAKAVQGLSPKINVWTTSGVGAEMDSAKPIRDIFQALPPLLTTIQEQTGITAPTWLAKQQGRHPM